VNALTRENKLLIAAGGNILFLISLFFDWFDGGFSGWDILPSAFLILIVALIAAAILAADAFRVALPPAASITAAFFLTVLNLYLTLLVIFEGNTAWGAFLGLLFIVVATVFAALSWREEH